MSKARTALHINWCRDCGIGKLNSGLTIYPAVHKSRACEDYGHRFTVWPLLPATIKSAHREAQTPCPASSNTHASDHNPHPLFASPKSDG